jgi:hypothetical protein
MDAENFDAWTIRLTHPRSRRGLLGGVLGFLTGVIGAQEGEAKRTRARTTHRDRTQTRRRKRQALASAMKCRAVGHPCGERQTCCPGLGCTASDRGSARRCTPCAAEGAYCASDEDCCGELVCDDRFPFCVTCEKEEDFCQIPFCNCCPGLEITCDETGCRCVPKPVTT